MRTFATVAVLAVLAAPAARAQSADEPSLAFTISAGLSTGQKLWNVDNQPLLAPAGAYDTVRLGRRLVPGLTASLGMSLFRSPHWGLNAEIGYFGVGSEQLCIGPAVYANDSLNLNRQGCENANGRHAASSAIGFLVGGVHQFLDSSSAWHPYIRANAGVGLLGASFVETNSLVHGPQCAGISPSDNICPYTILSERKKRSATFLVSLAGGFTVNFGQGYRIRMEGRDLIMQIPRVTGPADPTTGNIADAKLVVKHVPSFTIGLDVLLERRRTRRY